MKTAVLLAFLLSFIVLPGFSQDQKELVDLLKDQKENYQFLIKNAEKRQQVLEAVRERRNSQTGNEALNEEPKEENYVKRQLKSLPSLDSLEDHLKEAIHVQAQLLYPYNVLSIQSRTGDLANYLGVKSNFFDEHPSFLPVFETGEIIYSDQESASLAPVWSRSAFLKKHGFDHPVLARIADKQIDQDALQGMDRYFWREHRSYDYEEDKLVFPTSKRIDSIQFKVKIHLPVGHLDTLSLEHPEMETPEGPVRLEGVIGKQAYLRFPLSFKEKSNMEGRFKDGRIINLHGSASYNAVEPEKIKELKKLIVLYDTVIEQAKNGAFGSFEEAEAFIKKAKQEKGIPFNPKEIFYFRELRYYFPIHDIVFKIFDASEEPRTYDIGVKVDAYDNEKGLHPTAKDYRTRKKGILDEQGEWLIPPLFDKEIERINAYFYRLSSSQEVENGEVMHAGYYRLVSDEKRLEHITGYEPLKEEVIQNRYAKIKYGPYEGVMDVFSGKKIIPTEFRYFKYIPGGFWSGQYAKTGKFGVFSLAGEELIPFKYSSILPDNGLFKASVRNDPGQAKSRTVVLYDQKGNILTKGTYKEFVGDFSSGLLLAREDNGGDFTKPMDYVFLNEKGDEALRYKAAEYETVHPFKNGLALLKRRSDEKFGFIKPSGKIALPFRYDFASDFNKTYALIKEKSGQKGYFFIDQKGKKQMEINSELIRINTWYRIDREPLQMARFKNGTVYNFDGEQIESDL